MCQGKILDLVDINMLDKRDVESKVKACINLVLAGEDKEEATQDLISWVMENFRSQRLCDYLTHESSHFAMEQEQNSVHENKVFDLVNAQLEFAREQYGEKFHSLHEGWAVMLEEVEECEEVFLMIFKSLKEIWSAIKEDDFVRVNDLLEDIRIECNNGIVELSQVSAVVQKMMDTMEQPSMAKE